MKPVLLRIEDLKELPSSSCNNLVLPAGCQEVVHALVNGHLHSNGLRPAKAQTSTSDSIHQKGKNHTQSAVATCGTKLTMSSDNALVVLLHGYSGVGKTSLAGMFTVGDNIQGSITHVCCRECCVGKRKTFISN